MTRSLNIRGITLISTVLLWCGMLIGCSSSGWNNATTLSDMQLNNLINTSSKNIHYAGTKDGYDYFVAEKWIEHSNPSKAKETEDCYKVMQSNLITNRMDLTDDVSKWQKIK